MLVAGGVRNSNYGNENLAQLLGKPDHGMLEQGGWGCCKTPGEGL